MCSNITIFDLNVIVYGFMQFLINPDSLASSPGDLAAFHQCFNFHMDCSFKIYFYVTSFRLILARSMCQVFSHTKRSIPFFQRLHNYLKSSHLVQFTFKSNFSSCSQISRIYFTTWIPSSNELAFSTISF